MANLSDSSGAGSASGNNPSYHFEAFEKALASAQVGKVVIPGVNDQTVPQSERFGRLIDHANTHPIDRKRVEPELDAMLQALDDAKNQAVTDLIFAPNMLDHRSVGLQKAQSAMQKCIWRREQYAEYLSTTDHTDKAARLRSEIKVIRSEMKSLM